MNVSRRGILVAMAGLAASHVQPARAAEARPPLELLTHYQPPKPVTGLIMRDEGGQPVSLSAFANRLVVLNLWGSWCVPCREEIPTLSRLKQRLTDRNVEVLPLAIERWGAASVREFYDKAGISNLPILLGEGENLAEVFGNTWLPFTILIDRNGNATGMVRGQARWDDEAFVAWLLDQSA
jgi:thiol-disulfide isomerase/thioredoxin